MVAPVLSVVVATVDAEHSIDACLSALEAATASVPTEILVADGSVDGTLERVRRFPAVKTIPARPGTLVPALWSRGLKISRGQFVAFSIGQVAVGNGWAERMMSGFAPEVAGVGGAFTIADDAGPSASALFFLRYSNFIEERWRTGLVTGEIAGDNAMYRRPELVALGSLATGGFWDVEVHREVRRRGLSLAAVSNAAVTVLAAQPPRRVLAERFRHGRQFGATRVASRQTRRVRVISAAPFVPIVLTWRVARRVWPYSRYRRRLIGALPWLVVFAAAWAFGEAFGAWRGPAVRNRDGDG